MKDEKRYELYEKLYFHEVEAREKIAGRLQIPLALLLSVLSVFAVLVKGVSFTNFEYWHLFFYSFLGLSVFLFSISAVYFAGAFYNHGYSFMPSSIKAEDYRETLKEHYKGYEGCDDYVDSEFTKFIYSHFNKCSSANTVVNDLRSYRIHLCNRYLILTVAPLLVSFLILTFTGMGERNSKEAHKIELSGPILLEYPDKPVQIQGQLNSHILEIDLSNDMKEIMNVRREERHSTATTATTAH